MRSLAFLLSALVLWVATGASAQSPPAAVASATGGAVILLRVDGAIGPATAAYVERGLARAAQRDARLVVLQIDTPGGLDASMRAIIQAILASKVPVATFVSPAGARAASAGTYILYASHVAAMMPATTLGAATPVVIGLSGPQGGADPSVPASAGAPPATHDTLEAKRISDAAAYLRSLALLRGRNAEWADQAVREAASLSSGEALSRHVVDVVATDVADLLRQVDGRTFAASTGTKARLATAGASVEAWEPDWRDRLLAAIGDPGLAVLLMLIGFYGLVFEFANPGLVLPGVLGAICLMLGLFGLQTLPINAVGATLMLLGIGFLAAEAFVPSYGALGIGGVAALSLGAVMLIDSDAPGFGVPHWLIATLALVSFAFVTLLATLAAGARRRAVVSGVATLIGAVGEVVEAGAGDGAEAWALVHGEHWRVRGAQALRVHARVRVMRVTGLMLEVEGA